MKHYLILTLLLTIFISYFPATGHADPDPVTKSDVKALQREIHGIGMELTKLNGDTFPKTINSTFLTTNTRLESIASTLDSLKASSKPQPEWWGFFPNMWAEIAGGIVGAIIGAIVAIRVFNKTIWHEKVQEDQRREEERKKEDQRREEERAKEERRKEEKRKKAIAKREEEKQQNNNYFGILIINALKSVKAQSGYINQHVENIKQDPAKFSEMSYTPQQDLKRLLMMLRKEQYFHTYLEKIGNTKESIKDFRGISTSVDYLYEVIRQIKTETVPNAQRFDHERKKKYQLLFENNRLLAAEIAKQGEDQLPSLSDLIYRYITWRFEPNGPTEDINIIQNQYVYPFKGQLLEGFVNVSAARRILQDLVQLTHLHSDIIAHNQHHAEVIQSDLSNIDIAIGTLEESSKNIIDKSDIA